MAECPDDWWNELPLQALDPLQWEALCDGCGLCCLHKLEDADTGTVYYTRVHCRYLDPRSCRCGDYANRARNVPECVQLEPGGVAGLDWLPDTCAYRLRARGQPLADWHPLVSGDPESVHRAGISVRGRSIPEQNVDPDAYQDHIVHWVEGGH